MALATGFLLDPGTTAEQLATKRRLAEALMLGGSDYSPVASPWQGAARVAQALMGGYELHQADETQRTQREDASKRIGEALGFGGDTAPAAPVSPAPMAKPSGYGMAAQPAPATPAAQALATNAADFIKHEEGYAPRAKWDVQQNSGGYGSRAAPGEAFTPEKADAYLRRDMAPAEAWINQNVPNATPQQRTALNSFGYNLGTGALDKLKPEIQAGDWSSVAAHMQQYNKARSGPGGSLQPMQNLTERRAREAALIAGGAPQQAAPATPQNGNMLGIDRNTATAIQKLSLNPQTAPLANKLLELALSPKDLNGRYKDTENGVMDTRTGQIIPGTGRSKFAQTGENEYGRKEYGFVNPADESVKPYRSGPQVAGGAAQGDLNDPFAGAPANVVDRAKNILAGREALPLTARGDPTALQTQALVRKVDSQFDSNRFNYRKHWEDPNSATGKTRVANNTGIAHLFELHKMLEGAPDSGLGPLSHASTALQSWYRGASNDPWLNDYLANAKTLAGEVVKVNTGGEGAESDRRGIYDTIHPSVGKEALKQTLGKYIKLFAGKTHALADDWKKNMGPYADQPQVISDENQGMLDELKKAYDIKEDGAATAQSAIKVSSPAEAQRLIAEKKLKSGDHFIDEHGVDRTVH